MAWPKRVTLSIENCTKWATETWSALYYQPPLAILNNVNDKIILSTWRDHSHCATSSSKQLISNRVTGVFSDYLLAVWGLSCWSRPLGLPWFSLAQLPISCRFEAVGGLFPHICILPSSFVVDTVHGFLVLLSNSSVHSYIGFLEYPKTLLSLLLSSSPNPPGYFHF